MEACLACQVCIYESLYSVLVRNIHSRLQTGYCDEVRLILAAHESSRTRTLDNDSDMRLPQALVGINPK